MTVDPKTLNRALVVFLGHGISPYPDEQSARLKEEFGAELAAGVEPSVNSILDELRRLKPSWSLHPLGAPGAGAVHTLDSAGIWAAGEMHRRHPELDQVALNALKWAFTWWWR